jgi:uncharacterized protein YcbX
MTLIDTAITPSPEDPTSEDLTISISGTNKKVSIPARPSSSWLEENTTLADVKIWDTDTDGYVYSDAVNSVFNSFFDSPVKLVYKGPTKRILKGNAAPAVLGRTESTNFPDVMPVLITNDQSLDELNERLTKKGTDPITVERFRANIIVRGEATAWSEDSWLTIRLAPSNTENQSTGVFGYLMRGGPLGYLLGNSPLGYLLGGGLFGYLMGTGVDSIYDIDIRARCARCQVPNVHPVTAVKDKNEPWDTLVSYRRIDEGIKWKPCFGMLGVPRKEGEIEVGMKMEVLARTDKHNYKTGF